MFYSICYFLVDTHCVWEDFEALFRTLHAMVLNIFNLVKL